MTSARVVRRGTRSTGFKDSKGVSVRIGDNGQYRGMEFHVIRVGSELYLEKWGRLSIVSLTKESACSFTVTGRYGG